MAEVVLLVGAEGEALTIYASYEERRPGRGDHFSGDLDENLGLLRQFSTSRSSLFWAVPPAQAVATPIRDLLRGGRQSNYRSRHPLRPGIRPLDSSAPHFLNSTISGARLIGDDGLSFPPMLTEYIQAAMRHAHYEIMENGRFWGDIPPCQGCWGDGDTLEECRENLRGALECWILVTLDHHVPLPEIDGIDINTKVYAEADQMA